MWVNNALDKEQSTLFAGYELLAANCNSQKKPGSRCRGSCWTCWLSPPVSYSKHICSALLCVKMERKCTWTYIFSHMTFQMLRQGAKSPVKPLQTVHPSVGGKEGEGYAVQDDKRIWSVSREWRLGVRISLLWPKRGVFLVESLCCYFLAIKICHLDAWLFAERNEIFIKVISLLRAKGATEWVLCHAFW